MLEKIASGPETNRFSVYSGGGGPGAIFSQVQRIFCENLSADPGLDPADLNVLHAPRGRGLPDSGHDDRDAARLHRRVDEMVASVANRPGRFPDRERRARVLKLCPEDGLHAQWEADLRYETSAVESLPHTVVYLEGGYSDSNGPGYTARVLMAAGIRHIRGFWTNDTHSQWTINEIHWGRRSPGSPTARTS